MEHTISIEQAEAYIRERLVGQTLSLAQKARNCELYSLEFGERRAAAMWPERIDETVADFAIHALSELQIFRWGRFPGVRTFDGDSDCEDFAETTRELLGLPLLRVKIDGRNQLWLEFRDCWIRLRVLPDEEGPEECEGWRFFRQRSPQPHLVAYPSRLSLE